MMKKSQLFMIQLLLGAVRFIGLLIISLVLTVIGALWVKTCLYIGFVLLGVYILLVLIYAFRMVKVMSFFSDDDPEFNKMMEILKTDPQTFMSNLMEEQDRKRDLHGEKLLTLDDDELFETVYFQLSETVEDDEDVAREWENLPLARKTVYVLGLFDAEVQNGGLCQFFVNSSGSVAPFVSECLERVGADAHCELFDRFVSENGIDLSDLSSFKVQSRRAYIKQTKRFDFDAFDDRYYELTELQSFVTAYIRANINEF